MPTQKKITDLQLRSAVTDDLSLPSDDGIQSYRVTGLKFWDYVSGKLFTTTGQLLYASSASVWSRLGIGTTGQLLTVAGGVPTWADPQDFPGKYHFSAYYPASSVNYWSRANSSYGDMTATGTIPTPTTIRNANFGTLSKAASNLPGIALTAPRTGIIRCTATVMVLPTQSNSLSSWSIKMLESVTTTDIAFASGYTTNNTVNNLAFSVTLIGYFSATAATAYNFKIQTSNGVGTLYIGAGNAETCLGLHFDYIT